MKKKVDRNKWVLDDLSQLSAFLDDFKSYCQEKGVDEEKIFELELSVEELIANSFMHGYNASGVTGVVSVDVEDAGPEVRVSLHDKAPPFDLFRDAPPPRLGGEDGVADDVSELGAEPEAGLEAEEAPTEEKVGGLGIHLVKSLNDKIEYYGSKDGNIVVIIKAKK